MAMLPVNLASDIPERLLGEWLLIWTLLGAAAMLADKVAAKIEFDRMSEQGLAYIALAGGVAGVILGGLFFHHKTTKAYFWATIGTLGVLWLAFLVLYFFPGVVNI